LFDGDWFVSYKLFEVHVLLLVSGKLRLEPDVRSAASLKRMSSDTSNKGMRRLLPRPKPCSPPPTDAGPNPNVRQTMLPMPQPKPKRPPSLRPKTATRKEKPKLQTTWKRPTTIKPEMKIQPNKPRLHQGDFLAGMNRFSLKIVPAPTLKLQRNAGINPGVRQAAAAAAQRPIRPAILAIRPAAQ
jgi:hypothetical protein